MDTGMPDSGEGLSDRLGRPREAASVGRRVLLAGLCHKTNGLVCGRTTLENFEVRRGEELLEVGRYADPLAGVLRVARDRGWEVLPVLDMRAVPGATVSDAVVELFWAEFRAVADSEAASGVDGVFLLLHGAMVSESLEDVEGEILRRIRGIDHLSDAPVCGVMDPHTNFTEAMARQSDGLVSVREYPQADAGQAAVDAALFLDALMETQQRPATVWERPPVMWPPSGTATAEEPMRTLEERAREIEAGIPDVVAVNVLSGFPYSDVPEAGVSFSAVTMGDMEPARAGLRELNAISSFRRAEGNRIGMPLGEAMLRLRGHDEGPILLVEPADNVCAGAQGEGTHVLRALVEYGVPNAGVVINDPETVEALRDARPGECREVAIGGKSGEPGAEPLPLGVEVVSRSDGRFAPEDRRTRPDHLFDERVDMGPCCVVRHEGVTVLLTSHRTPPFDLGQWRSQGIDPAGFFAVGVKAAVEHRPAYDPVAKASYTVDVPGPCPEDLRRLPFGRVGRPVYPLDEL